MNLVKVALNQLGNRRGSQNETVSHGMVNFSVRNNGLNQYENWSPSIIYHDDNWPGLLYPPGNGVTVAEGNLVARYNALNQPVEVYPTGSSAIWFGYDPLGRCVKRTVGSEPTTFFYYDGWNIAQEGSSGASPTRVYAHGARVDEIIASSRQATGEIAFHY